LKRRLNEYRTGFVSDSYYVCVSEREFQNSRMAESLLFYILRRYRMRRDREFFQIESWQIRDLFTRLAWHDDEWIAKCWRAAVRKVCPTHIMNMLSPDDEDFQLFWEKSGVQSEIDKRYEAFRFKPQNPAMYRAYGYIPPEIQELNGLTSTAENDFGELTLS